MSRISTSLWIAGVLVLAGCKKDSKDAKEEASAADPKTADPTTPEAADPKAPAPGAPSAVAPSADAACAKAVEHIAAIAVDVKVDVAVETASCVAERWPEAFLRCATTAPDVNVYADACMKTVFPPDTRLEIKRVFYAGDDNSAVTPKAGSQDGDFVVYSREQRCGMLWIQRKPAEAGYVLCGDTLMAGPLTTVPEIEEAFAEFSRLSKASHDLQMDLMKKWPTGRTVEVYDEVGNYVGEKVE